MFVVAKEENRQADMKNRSENSMMPTQGKQQSVLFIPRYPQPIYWAYYPIPYSPNQINYCHNNYHHYHHPHQQQQQHHAQNDDNNQYHQEKINQEINASLYSYYGQQDDTQNIYPQTIYGQQFYDENIPVYGVQELENSPMIQETEKEIGQNELNADNHEKKIINLQKNSEANPAPDPEEKNALDETTDVSDDKQEKSMQNKAESDEGDSETTTSEISELSSAENCQVKNDIQENLSSSESSDSDSYLAYSTGRTGLDEEKCEGLNAELEDKQISTDCESFTEENEKEEKKKVEDLDSKEKNEEEKSRVENVISFSGPRLRSDTPNKIDESGWKDIPTDEDYPGVVDEEDASTIVSVSLPFRPQFPVLKKDEIIDEKASADLKEIINSVSLSLRIDKEPSTTVDFTLRKNPSTRPKSWCPDKLNDDFWTSKTILGQQGEAIECTEENKEKKNNNDEEKNKNEAKRMPSFEVTVEDDKINDDKVEEDEEESADESKKNKYLLTVQNSRDETDDDDSGVTSDMSRLISEVDTDSECTPSRKAITYKRTQTHSRLFRLLSEDLSQDTIEKEKSKRRNRLSLPIKNSSEFSYDYSNQSSGMTSPDYSPVYERPSSRNFQKIFNTTVVSEPGEEDRYFKIWKNSKDTDEANKLKNHNEILSSTLTGKFEENKSSIWSHRSNVLCPRIKSTRSSDGRIRKPVVHSTATNYSKYDRARKSEY